MRRNSSLTLSMALALAAGLPAAGCAKKDTSAAPVAEVGTPVPAGDGKIPITTASAEAKAEFLQGRDLAEKLQVTDSYQHFQKAASLDPNFAWAELNLANSAPTGKEFFEHLNKAVGLADKASNGERLLILATQAGANNDAVKQKEHLEALVAAYPNDERAHFNLGGYYFGQQDYPKAIEHYKKATGARAGLLDRLQHPGLRLPAERGLRERGEGVPEVHRAHSEGPEPLRLLRRAAAQDGPIRRLDRAVPQGAGDRAQLRQRAPGHRHGPPLLGQADRAVAELAELSKKARTDGEKRTALFARTIVHLDGGQTAKALGGRRRAVRARRRRRTTFRRWRSTAG